MPFATVQLSALLLASAAIISALGGLITTMIALRKNRTEEQEHTLEELAKARAESEKLAKELHELRMSNEDQQ